MKKRNFVWFLIEFIFILGIHVFTPINFNQKEICKTKPELRSIKVPNTTARGCIHQFAQCDVFIFYFVIFQVVKSKS